MSIQVVVGSTKLKSSERTHSPRIKKRSQGPREFYTVSQLAELLQLDEVTIYRMAKGGVLPCYEIGRAKRFKRSDVDEFLESRGPKRRGKLGDKAPARSR